MRQTLAFEGVVTEQDARRGSYIYLPFAVPPRTRRIDVSYHYERPIASEFAESGGNALDVGIFDSRGTEFLTDGFRGFSGATRSSFFITPQEATPGYLKGPLLPGQWNLLLGIARLKEPPCRYWVSVDLDVAQDTAAPADPSHPRPATLGPAHWRDTRQETRATGQDAGGRWYRGDLHTHTVHSDGLNTVAELVAYSRGRGLDFLAITDHNTCSHQEEMDSLVDPGLVLIPGEEVTTYRGHGNVWGLRQWLDFRCEDAETIRRVLRFVESRGLLFSVNHPKSVGPPWELGDLPELRTMEVWQAPWRWYNWESLALWEEKLSKGLTVVAVGGSDTHSIPPARPTHPHGPGEPCTWVYVEGPLHEQAVLHAIAAGHVVISEDPSGPFLTLWASSDGGGRFEHMVGDTIEGAEGAEVTVRLEYHGPQGKKLRLYRGREVMEEFEADSPAVTRGFTVRLEEPTYLRAEVRGFRGRPERGEVVHAMTNPLYLAVARG